MLAIGSSAASAQNLSALNVPAAVRSLDVAQGAAVQPHVHHRAYEHADHVVEKPVGFDVEAHAPALGPDLPLGAQQAAAIVWFGRALRRERAEVVLAQKQRRGGAERRGVQRAPERPLVAVPEGRGAPLALSMQRGGARRGIAE